MLKNEDAWTKSVETNEDRYGDAVISYAERWARLMEGRIAHGGTVDGCAEETSRIADSEHITAFMYDCAASVLSQFWIHGEELNKWHKLAISPWERSAAKSLATIAPVGGDEKYGTAST